MDKFTNVIREIKERADVLNTSEEKFQYSKIIQRNLFIFNTLRKAHFSNNYLFTSLLLDTNVKAPNKEVEENLLILNKDFNYIIVKDKKCLSTDIALNVYLLMALYEAKTNRVKKIALNIKKMILPQITNKELIYIAKDIIEDVLSELEVYEGEIERLAKQHKCTFKIIDKCTVLVTSTWNFKGNIDEWYIIVKGRSIQLKHIEKMKGYHTQEELTGKNATFSNAFRIIKKHDRYVMGGRKYYSNKMSRLFQLIEQTA